MRRPIKSWSNDTLAKLGFKRGNRKLRRSKPRELRLESLEERAMLVGTSFDEATGVLIVDDTVTQDNQITIRTEIGGDLNQYVVVNDARVQYEGPAGPADLRSDQVEQLKVLGDDGDDTIDLQLVAVTSFPNLTEPVEIDGGEGADIIHGSQLNDTIDGAEGDDQIQGNNGNDSIEGGIGNDTLLGGAGDDTYLFQGTSDFGDDVISETPTGGADTLDFSGLDVGSGITIDLSSDAEQDIIAESTSGSGSQAAGGGAAIDDIIPPIPPLLANTITLTHDGVSTWVENVIGTQYADDITGNELNNELRGGADRDILWGREGNDALYGEDGNDDLHGESGNDALDGGVAGDDRDRLFGGPDDDIYQFGGNVPLNRQYVSDSGGEDTLDFSNLDFSHLDPSQRGIAVDLGITGVQTVVNGLDVELASATAMEKVVGTPFDDRITGNTLDNELSGGDGSDTYLFVGSQNLGSDTIVEAAGEGDADTLDFYNLADFVSVDRNVSGKQTVGSLLELTLIDGPNIEVLAPEGLGADIIFVVDESGSMGLAYDFIDEQGWIADVVVALQEELTIDGLSGNRYGLAGFSHSSSPTEFRYLVRDGAFGDATDLAAATSQLRLDGGSHEDGYAGIAFALDNYPIHAARPINIVLVTDEHRTIVNSQLDEEGTLTELLLNNAVLNVAVNATFDGTLDAVPHQVLGVHRKNDLYRFILADDQQELGFRVSTDASHCGADGTFTNCISHQPTAPKDSGDTSAAEDTFAHYIDLAWDSGGATWDLNAFRPTDPQGMPLYADAFIAALADIKAQEIADLVLVEETHFVAERTGTIFAPEVGDPPLSSIEVTFDGLQFDVGAGNPADVNDAFELAVLLSDGTPAVSTITSGSDAVFNISQGQDPIWAEGVQLLDSEGQPITDFTGGVTAGTVQIDIRSLSTLPVGSTIEIVARLINNDADDTSSVVLGLLDRPGQGTFPVTGTPSANLLPTPTNESDRIYPGIHFQQLHDVTRAFEIEYQHTTIDEPPVPIDPLDPPDPRFLDTRLALTKKPGSLQVRGDLLLAVTMPVDQETGQFLGTQPSHIDGRLPFDIDGLPAGTPFIRVTDLIPTINGFYVDDTSADQIRLAFEHFGYDRFDYDLVVLGQLNEPPSFTSDPYDMSVATPTRSTFSPRQAARSFQCCRSWAMGATCLSILSNPMIQMMTG